MPEGRGMVPKYIEYGEELPWVQASITSLEEVREALSHVGLEMLPNGWIEFTFQLKSPFDLDTK